MTILTSKSGASAADAGLGAGIPGPNFGIVTGPFSVSKPQKLLQPGPPLSQMTSVSLRKA
eukprot:scaffold848_cov153-Skeletonema_menzelii.AAC.9